MAQMTKKPNILLNECKSAIMLLRFLGLFPAHIDTARKFKFKHLLIPILYIILCYAFSMFISTKQMIRRILIISSKRCNFDCVIFSLATLYVLVPTMLIPVAFWWNMKRTIMFWDDCYAFQIRYESLVGKPMKVRFKTFVTICVIASITEVLLVTTLPSAFIANFNFVATATYYVVFGGFVAGVCYWLSVCLFLKQSANNILQFTSESFTKWSIQKQNIIICYELWATVQSLLKQFGKSMEFFLLIDGFSLALEMLNSMYGFVSQLYATELGSKNIRHACGHLMLSVWSFSLIVIINESSYQVVNTFTYKFKKMVLLVNMNNLSAVTKNQITEFYQIFRNTDSKLSFSGFNAFSRAFLITILSASITYMVILLQIRNDYLLSQKQMLTTMTCPTSNHSA